jgi:hypothetical protein
MISPAEQMAGHLDALEARQRDVAGEAQPRQVMGYTSSHGS